MIPKLKQSHCSGPGVANTWSRNSGGVLFAMLGRDEFDIGRVGNGVPNYVVSILVLEPAAIGIVPAKVRVDDICHGTDIAFAVHLANRDEQPGMIQPPVSLLGKVAEVPLLYVAGRYRTHRRPVGLGARAS